MRLTITESARAQAVPKRWLAASGIVHGMALTLVLVRGAATAVGSFVPREGPLRYVELRRDPPAAARAAPQTGERAVSAPAVAALPRIDVPTLVPVEMPSSHLAAPADPGAFTARAFAPGGLSAPRRAVPAIDRVFDAATADLPVQPHPGNRAPRYPAVLAAAGIEGEVVMRFVVDTLGRVERGSVLDCMQPAVWHRGWLTAARRCVPGSTHQWVPPPRRHRLRVLFDKCHPGPMQKDHPHVDCP
jgi:hypothetical protein